jgi:hypothetical protein
MAREKSGFKAGLRRPSLAEVPLADLSFGSGLPLARGVGAS